MIETSKVCRFMTEWTAGYMFSNHIFSCKTCDHSCHYGTDDSKQYGPTPMASSRLALPIQEFKIGLSVFFYIELKVQMFGNHPVPK